MEIKVLKPSDVLLPINTYVHGSGERNGVQKRTEVSM